MNERGQLISADFVPALVVFIGIFIGLLLSWNTTTEQIDDTQEANNMRRTALMASDSLVRSQGVPVNWTNESVAVIGLSDGNPNVLDDGSVGELLDTPYNDVKEVLGIRDDIYIELNQTDGTIFSVDGEDATYGKHPVAADDVVVVRRFFLLDDERGVMTLKVWN